MTDPKDQPAGSIPFTELVRGLPAAIPFVGPETIERRNAAAFEARIGANESAFGISPKARAAMTRAISEVAYYNDPEGHDLRAALAVKHGVAMDEICLGAGIDEILGNIVRMVVTPGSPVVTSRGAYPTFNYHVAGFGGRLHTVPYRDDREDPEALLEAVHETGAPLVFLANPDNPMGTWQRGEVLQRFIERLPERCLFVYDEAYIEFAPQEARAPIDTSDPRVLRMRTFSKAYGMAGARIGYCIAHRDLVTGLGKIRNHFGVNRIAQAGALASLEDEDFLQGVIAAVDAGRRETYALAQGLGLAAIPSATNFVAIDVSPHGPAGGPGGGPSGRAGGGSVGQEPAGAGADSGARAREILKRMEDRRIFIRMPGVAPQDRCIRVSIGRPDERRLFAEALSEILRETA